MSKEREVLLKILELANAGSPVTISEDWGGGSATVEIGGRGHSHVGVPDGSEDQFIDSLHAMLCEGRGLSFAEGSE